MAKVLTTNSTVLCDVTAPKLHGGGVSKTGADKLKVSSSGVLLPSGLGPISDCKTVPPPSGQTACTSVTSILPVSIATKLRINGIGVLLETLKGVTSGTPPGSLYAEAKQTKLTSV